jgi:HNH endonuclease
MEKIKLTRGQVALVDDEDFEMLNMHKWFAVPAGKNGRTFYAARRIWNKDKNRQEGMWMHRLLAKTPKGFHTDHIDGNGLNNQKSNLRVCTNSQNQFNKGKSKRNSSGYKGVSWFKHGKLWDVRISVNKKSVHVGYFHDIEEAHKAYTEAAKKLHGQFAHS